MRLILERRASWAELQEMPASDALAIYDGISFMAAQSDEGASSPTISVDTVQA